MDVSADLDELAMTPVLVVCAGPKSMLDVDLTLEYLETSGVPVLGWGTTELAGFYARSSGRTLAGSVADASAAARVATAHWALGLASGIVICAPLPEDAALSADEAEAAVAQATADAAAAGVHGPAATPFTLARVAELTGGRSVKANLALIENNASIAAQIAAALLAK
jgi:pseudouridine-5'-phosphate glycosidase